MGLLLSPLIYRGQEKQTKARDKVREVEGRVREAGSSDPLYSPLLRVVMIEVVT